MRGRGLVAGFVAALGALAGSCGGPPPMLTGDLTYAYQCTGENSCLGGALRWSGGVGQGDPPLQVLCEVQTLSSGRTRFNVRLVRAGLTEEGRGVHICGEAAGPGEVSIGSVDLYFDGDASERNQLPSGACRVRVSSLSSEQVSGQLQCEGATGQITPPRMYKVSGSATAPMTMDPAWADFNFTTCAERVVSPCG